MSSEREARCPECGSRLAVSVERNKRSGELKIRFWCDGDYDDKFQFEIFTGLRNEDLGTLQKKGKVELRPMRLKLLERESIPDYVL